MPDFIPMTLFHIGSFVFFMIAMTFVCLFFMVISEPSDKE
jgi:hypothetical protein